MSKCEGWRPHSACNRCSSEFYERRRVGASRLELLTLACSKRKRNGLRSSSTLTGGSSVVRYQTIVWFACSGSARRSASRARPHALERAWPRRAGHACTRRYSLPNSNNPNLHPMMNEMTKQTAPMIVAIMENILALLQCS